MNFLNKVKWFVGITLIFSLIAATNLIDRTNFERIKNSVTTIYKDRLVAKDYIFQISELIQEKEVSFYKQDTSFFRKRNLQINKDIASILIKYDGTRLTKDEVVLFKELTSNIQKLEAIETKDNLVQNNPEIYPLLINNLKLNLKMLSAIQLTEGKRELNGSQATMDMIELYTNLEIYALIILAIIVQIIVMYPSGKRKANL